MAKTELDRYNRRKSVGRNLAVTMVIACAFALNGCGDFGKDKDLSKREDAPFGLAMGDLIPDLAIAGPPDKNGLTLMKKVPNPQIPFQTYAIVVRENIGICRVIAISGSFATGNVDAVVDRIETAKRQIASKYGPPQISENSCKSAVCASKKSWAFALAHKQASYYHLWENGDRLLGKTIKSIRLEALTNEIIEPYIRIEYVFANQADCANFVEKS